jgi:hypothetical protein
MKPIEHEVTTEDDEGCDQEEKHNQQRPDQDHDERWDEARRN